MTKLPHGIEIEDREHTASEVVDLVLEGIRGELMACVNAIQDRLEKARVETEPQNFLNGLREANMMLKARANALGMPNRIEDAVTRPLDVSDPDRA